MDFLNLNNLAVGGALAALVGFWNQFKSFARYLSSLMVIQVQLDSSTSNAVIDYLKTHYKILPSGIYNILSHYVMLRSSKSWRHVPFRAINEVNVFYGDGNVLFVHVYSDTLKLYGIRGSFDCQSLVCRALDYQIGLRSNNQSKSSNFYVYSIMGSEKGAWGSQKGRNNRGDQDATISPSAEPVSGNSSANLQRPQLAIDVSFQYPVEEYRYTAQDDPFKALFFPPDTMEHIKECKQWLTSKDWYAERSIPWRRGWLIHGPGGTGKSSLSLAIGKSLGLPIHQYHLSTLSDQEFVAEWGRMQVPAIVLFEDFDTVFDKREALTEHKSLTFDCILNTISGVSSTDGVFLIVTTNHIEKIDAALGVESKHGSISTRPGRIDQVLYLGVTTEDVRARQVQHILRDWPEDHSRLVAEGDGMTPVQFQELCVQYAYSRLGGNMVQASHV